MSRRSISLLSSLLFVLLLFTPAILAENEQQFQEFARDIPADRLHAALHDYNGAKFKHGVFPGDRPALDVIHRERAADASRLVKLAKRQTNITTTSRNTVSTSRPTTTPPTTIATTTTTGPSSTGQTTRRTTSESGSTTSAPSSATKRTTSSTSKITKTVTGADGSISTITDVTVVLATPTDGPTAPPSGETTSSTKGDGSANLQNVGLRVSVGDSVIVVVIAALGFFML